MPSELPKLRGFILLRTQQFHHDCCKDIGAGRVLNLMLYTDPWDKAISTEFVRFEDWHPTKQRVPEITSFDCYNAVAFDAYLIHRGVANKTPRHLHLMTIQIINSDFESQDLFDKLKFDLTLSAAFTFESMPKLNDSVTLEKMPTD